MSIGYLAKTNLKGKVRGVTHLWRDGDTVCHMWSGALQYSKKTYSFFSEPKSTLCSICAMHCQDLDEWQKAAAKTPVFHSLAVFTGNEPKAPA